MVEISREERDAYLIPQNFVDTGTILGGTVKLRNAVEAAVLAVGSAIPLFYLPMAFNIRLMIVIAVSVPLGVFGVVGIGGDSLTQFVAHWFRFMKRRRIVTPTPQGNLEANRHRHLRLISKRYRVVYYDDSDTLPHNAQVLQRKADRHGKLVKRQTLYDLLPIEKIENGILHTTDDRYIKILEIEPMDGIYHAYLMIPADGYRAQVIAGWMALLVNAGDGIDVDLFLERQPKERMMQKIGQQIRINRSKIKDTSDTNSDFDDLSNAIRSGYYLKDGLANNEDFYYAAILVTVTAASVKDLEWRIGEIRKLMVSQDMNLQLCSFRQEAAFLSSLPLCAPDTALFKKYRRNILTSTAASFYPFVSFELCDTNGVLLGVNKYNNSLVSLDNFSTRIYKNANMAILGTSGAGKTFTMQLIARRMRLAGTPVYIIAPLKGHEFYRQAKALNGTIIRIVPGSPDCINVMEIRKIDHTSSELLDGPMPEQSELAAKIQKLHIFFSLLIPDLSNEERQLLDEAIVTTYRNKGITYDNASLDDPAHPGQYREMPILGDLHAVLSATPETRRIANILNRLVHGSASSFNRQTNVNLDNSYVVIDISELSGDLLTVGMYIGLDYMWDKAKEDLTRRKQIFIDEVWQIIGASSNALAANYVFEAVKTIRGYGGGVLVATQDLNDFFSLEDGKYGRGILNNCKIKIILNLEEEEAQRVQSVLKLTDAEIDNITRFERGSALIVTNSNNVTVDMRCSEEEKDLITTDRDELRRIVERKMQNQTETEES